MAGLLTAVGLAAPAGLNAYLVLLIVGLAARIAGTVVLPPALAWLGNPWVLVVLGAALTAEIFIAKMPRLAPASERIGLAVRPIAGALVAMAGAAATDLAPLAAAAVGAVCAGAVHLLKAAVRARVTTASGGLAIPLVSMLEDLVAATGAVLTLLRPLAGVMVALTIVALLVGLLLVLRRHGHQSRLPEPPEAPTATGA